MHKERGYDAILRTVCITGKLRQQRQSIILMTIIWEKKKIKYINKYDCGIVYVFRRKWILLWVFNIFLKNKKYCSVFSSVWLFVIPWTVALQALLSCTISRFCSNSCLLSWWCYLTISSSATPFFFGLQFFPASGSFLMSQILASGGQSIGASPSVLPMNIQGWFSLGLTGLISLWSKGLSKSLLQQHSSKAQSVAVSSQFGFC